MKLWSNFVALMDEREPATRLAMVRIALGVVLLCDLFWVEYYDLVTWLWGTTEQGGVGTASLWDMPPWSMRLLGEHTATVMFAVVALSAFTFTLGLFTRFSNFVLLIAYAQLAAIMPTSDRGIDMIFRATLVILLFSRCGKTLSLDARRRTGAFVDESAAPAWPRHLIVLQLVWVYFTAGVHKTQSAWWPAGELSALWRVLHDPHFARFDATLLSQHVSWTYPMTQLGTAGTMIFEVLAPLFLLALYYRRTAHRPGRVRALFNRLRVREAWLLLGVSLHLGLLLTINLGIFPLGMLALYPVFLKLETSPEREFARPL